MRIFLFCADACLFLCCRGRKKKALRFKNSTPLPPPPKKKHSKKKISQRRRRPRPHSGRTHLLLQHARRAPRHRVRAEAAGDPGGAVWGGVKKKGKARGGKEKKRRRAKEREMGFFISLCLFLLRFYLISLFCLSFLRQGAAVISRKREKIERKSVGACFIEKLVEEDEEEEEE